MASVAIVSATGFDGEGRQGGQNICSLTPRRIAAASHTSQDSAVAISVVLESWAAQKHRIGLLESTI